MAALSRQDDFGEHLRGLQRLPQPHWALEVDSYFGVTTEADLANGGIAGSITHGELLTVEKPAEQGRPLRWLVRDLRWRSQRDNEYVPNGTCNVTSLAMVLDWCGVEDPPEQQLEDALYQRLQQPDAKAFFKKHFPGLQTFNPRNVHGMLTWLAEQYGATATFSMTSTWDDRLAWASLNGGRPCIQSGNVTGSGHIVVLMGETATGDPVVHDPYGDWKRGYRSGQSGKYRIYTLDRFLAVRKPYTHFTVPS